MKKQIKLPLNKIKIATKKPVKNQLHFGCYWEYLKNRQPVSIHSTDEVEKIAQKNFEVVSKPNFNLKLKRRRPLWKDIMVFAGTTMSIWGISHVAMNYAAFAEIANYKIQTSITNIKEKFQPKQIEKLKKVKKHQKNYKYEGKNSAKKTFQEMIVYPADNRIVLPRIGKNVPLITVSNNKNWKQVEKTIQKGLQNGVVVHPISHDPSSFGNFFLTGHSSYYAWDKGRYKDVFALLHELKDGDKAIVYWEGKKYTYILEKSRVIPPTEVSVLNQPTDKSIITLMTCTPVGTNKNRLIWTGELISVE
jgi:LPXTG-site transpeptidase (sortase) family protein